METSLAFIPRIVTQHAKPWHGISRFSPTPSPSSDDESDDEDDEPSDSKGKRKAVEGAQTEKLAQDIASLISLALSDYTVWLNADMRRKLDACLSDDTCPDGAGFVSINYLLRRPPFSGSLPGADPSETEVVKALRAHASDTLEVRMRLPSSPSVWYGTGKTARRKDVGGYEVRRKDWASLRDRPSRGWTRARWDDLTTYVEGIPPRYRTVGGIVRCVALVLASDTDTDTDRPYVQHVVLPPHYLDRPGDTPKCRGYALVTLGSKAHAEALRRAWPWTRGAVPEGASSTATEAHKYGLRTISKARWDALNEEYLRCRQSLVDAIAETEVHQQAGEGEEHGQGPEEETETQERTTTRASPYPYDCLVFVRHVHPDTNKTTLKALFGRAFRDESVSQAQPSGDTGLDYVDFNKGMDTCHLRLASPQHAMRLKAYFSTQGIAQANGLDAMGRTPVQNDKPIAMEMVQGKKEAVYWEKVPEKVRRQAVDKAIKATSVASVSPTTHIDPLGRKKRRREP